MAESLKNKTVKGTAWSAIDSIANQGISFLVSLVLARILTPQEYGLIGIISIFIQLFNVFIVSGFNSALIRKADCRQADYSTVFIFNIVVSGILFGVLWLCAPYIADFFNRQELVPLTRAMGIILIINALALVQTTILTKEIDFKKQTKISLISSIASGVVGIAMALTGYGVWALVGQQVSRQTINALLLWVWSRWRPQPIFSVSSFKEMWGFGWKLLVSSLIDNGWKELYQVVIGKFYQPATLGQYSRAVGFARIFSSNLTNIVQRVSYPVLSSIQDDQERLKQAYRRIIKSSMLVTFICMIGLAAIAKPMVIVLIGEKWLMSVGFLQIVCFGSMLYPLHAINLNMLQVKGRSDLFLRLEIIKKAIAVGPLLLGIFWSIYAMLIGSVLTGFISYYLNAYYSGPMINYSISEQIKDVLPSFGIAMAIAVPAYLISYLPFSPFILLPLQLITGATIGIIILENTHLPEYGEIREIGMKLIKKVLKAKS